MQVKTGCAFCRANSKQWDDHNVDICIELAKCVCGYCKKKGHTPKKCPKSALKKQREEEWVKCQEEKKKKGKSETTSTWSSIVVNSLTDNEREVMNQQHRVNQQRKVEEKRKQYEERKKKREEYAQKAEQHYVCKMRRKYGIKACDFAETGDFWFFFVEGEKDDSNMAKVLRKEPKNQVRFKEYLQEKYWVNWLSKSEFSEDDCRILEQWRWEEETYEYEQEKREEEDFEAYLKAEEALIGSMEAKVEKGEITQAEFNEWKFEKDLDDDYAWQEEGDMIWRSHQQLDSDFKVWKQRSEGRK